MSLIIQLLTPLIMINILEPSLKLMTKIKFRLIYKYKFCDSKNIASLAPRQSLCSISFQLFYTQLDSANEGDTTFKLHYTHDQNESVEYGDKI
jgi:hypothetical protein